MRETTPAELDWSKTPNRNPEYEYQDSFLVNTRRANDAIYVNATARMVWELCDGRTSVEQLSADLESAYPEARDAVREDVRQAITRFVSHGVVFFTG